MKLRGIDTQESIREWFKDWIKSSISKSYDLGKFIFNISLTSIGIVVSIKKFSNETLNAITTISLLFFLLSALSAIFMIFPKKNKIDSETNLLELYTSQVRVSYRFFWFWFCLWLLGLVLGILSLFIFK